MCDCQTDLVQLFVRELGATCLECAADKAQVIAIMESVRRTKKPPRRTWARGLKDAGRVTAPISRTSARRLAD